MHRIQQLLRSFGPAGAAANARRSCDELRVRQRDIAAIERHFAARPTAARLSRVA